MLAPVETFPIEYRASISFLGEVPRRGYVNGVCISSGSWPGAGVRRRRGERQLSVTRPRDWHLPERPGIPALCRTHQWTQWAVPASHNSLSTSHLTPSWTGARMAERSKGSAWRRGTILGLVTPIDSLHRKNVGQTCWPR